MCQNVLSEMTASRVVLILCLLLYTSNSHAHTSQDHAHRSRRGLLGDDAHHHDHTHDHAHDQASARELVNAADSRSLKFSPSSANSPPNSWLYKFPPWFLPSNPAPEGFLPTRKTQASGPEFSMIDDGDILIIDDFDNNEERSNVRVPGNSAFQDEVVRTLLGVKFGKNQNPAPLRAKIPSAEVVTPWLVPQSVPEPPLPSPAPTVPFSFQGNHGSNAGLDNNLVTGRPQGDKFGISNTGNIFVSKTLVTESTPTDYSSSEFRPSPPDLSFTVRPLNAAQEGHTSGGSSSFRPSQLISVTHVKETSSPRDQAVTSHEQQHNLGNNIQQNSINSNFFKDQQAALLKASDRPQTLGNRNPVNDNNVRNTQSRPMKQRDPSWIPFLPGIPLPILQQLSQAGRRGPPQQNRPRPLQHQRGSQGNRQAFNNDLRLHHQTGRGATGSESAPLPTSIQDIINGDYDTAQALYRKGRNQDSSLVTSDGGNVHASVGDGDKWLWPTS